LFIDEIGNCFSSSIPFKFPGTEVVDILFVKSCTKSLTFSVALEIIDFDSLLSLFSLSFPNGLSV